MHGLFRVREFTQDDSHIFCTQDQIKDVIFEVLEFVDSLLKMFDFKYEIEVQQNLKKQLAMIFSGKKQLLELWML